jgi:hypothetical protein
MKANLRNQVIALSLFQFPKVFGGHQAGARGSLQPSRAGLIYNKLRSQLGTQPHLVGVVEVAVLAEDQQLAVEQPEEAPAHLDGAAQVDPSL